jgi:hypothetical protein
MSGTTAERIRTAQILPPETTPMTCESPQPRFVMVTIPTTMPAEAIATGVMLRAPSASPSTVSLAAIPERGGFLNSANTTFAVPWKAFQATADLSLFVLNVGEQTLDDAPSLDPDGFGDPSTFSQTRRTVDEFW